MTGLTEPMWLDRARDMVGIREIAGALHEPKIMQLWRDARIAYDAKGDEDAWCSAFVGAMLERSMITTPRKPNARSYADWGIDVLDQGIEKIPVGAVLVWSRPPKAWQGHVCFALARAHDRAIQCLGGNQSDSVSIARFKEANGRELIAARWPIEERDSLRLLRDLPLLDSTGALSANEA